MHYRPGCDAASTSSTTKTAAPATRADSVPDTRGDRFQRPCCDCDDRISESPFCLAVPMLADGKRYRKMTSTMSRVNQTARKWLASGHGLLRFSAVMPIPSPRKPFGANMPDCWCDGLLAPLDHSDYNGP